MKKKALIVAGVVLLLIVVVYLVGNSESAGDTELMTNVQMGDFEVKIVTTGELEAKNSVEILGPSGLRNFRIFQVNIQDIAEEGTEVKKGEWIATLDPSELSGKLTDAQTDLEKRESEYTQTRLDTTLQMSQFRDELINLKYAVEEKEIVLEQSQYEPPATIKQAEINVDKARRALSQAQENYKIKLQQNIAKMRIAAGALNKTRRDYEEMMKLRQDFTIKAPEDGMLIYRKGNDGKPMKEGSQINAWDPVVATLPDLSTMLSKTYINEVDVRKVKVGQPVNIGLDAFPDKELKGMVISVANVGEQRPNSDAKVFRVDIEIEAEDPLLKPAMTTSNIIMTNTIPQALQVPLETLHNEKDSITYVYLKEGLNITKQEVNIGVTNAENAVILAGVKEGDRLYLSVPGGKEDDAVNLLPEMNGKRNKKEPEPEKIESGRKEKSQRDGRNIKQGKKGRK